CTEAEEDLEDDQLLCTQESNENYFADTEDCSSVSSETDSALSDSESWDESLSGRTSHIQLALHDDTPELWFDALDLIVENEESQYQDNELFEAPHAENAKPKDSESILSVTSNQQSATHAGPTTQSQAAQSPVSNPLWNGDSKLNMAPPQCSDEEIHSGQEWEESGEGLASWFDLCENEDAGENEHSRWEMSSIEPNKTDG
ncbi:hypothetical protein pdam_00024781, partial [Pocillopora damicornis]